MKKIKTIYEIARTELQTLFYSPVAWLILIIFAFQVAMAFCKAFEGYPRWVDLGSKNFYNVTWRVFADNWNGTFKMIQQYIYLYIPLLTMGLMSREYSSGSIKLLYSSPITSTQIILGKFLSTMVYGLAMIGVLCVFVLFSAFAIHSFDFAQVLTGLFGLYLLICAYAAIGLFMSAITSYQVVAAMGTLAILAVLNFIGTVAQDVEFVRDITYWLSISGRCGEFINGLICSEDLLYFLIIIVMFLMFSIIKLQAERTKKSFSFIAGKYTVVFCVAMLLGYLSSRPMFMVFYDSTKTKTQTLTKNSQEIISKMKGGMTITSYANLLDPYYWCGMPGNVNQDLTRFKQYRRFKPDIKMKYAYYWDKAKNPDLDKRYPNLSDEERAKKMASSYNQEFEDFLRPEEVKKKVDLSSEGNRFVKLLERESGEKTFLRVFDDMQVFPFETEISAAFKRLVMPLPKVGFLAGHGERDCGSNKDRDYNRFAQDKPFRYSLINQGFDFLEVNLEKPVPDTVNILVIAELKSALTETEMANLNQYIQRGGNMLIAGEPRRQDFMNPLTAQLGIEFLPGRVVKMTESRQPDLQLVFPTKEAESISYNFGTMRDWEMCATMPGMTGLKYTEDKGYKAVQLLVTDTAGGCWSELQTTDFIDDTPKLDTATGEKEEHFVAALALSRNVAGREQRIAIFGDADCLSNAEISINRKDVRAQNYWLITGTFFWLSDNQVPIDIRRPTPPDNMVNIGQKAMQVWKITFMGALPGILLVSTLMIWLRRRGR